MPEYKVIEDFTDLQDKDHVYYKGDPFPREGAEVSEERIQELATKNNKRNTVLIKEVPTVEGKHLEELTAEELQDVKNDDIKARLDELEIDYKSNDTKDKLIERLHGKEGDN